MPEIQYPTNPNSDTAFVVQDDGKKNRALMTAPQDISTLELSDNPNSTKGYVTIDGKKHRVNLVADITGGGGGGSSLPDQTGHSGEFLTTDGTDASWSDKPLVNSGTGSQSIGILSTASGTFSVAVGKNATANKDNACAVGALSSATGITSLALGYGATATKQNAIQIGNGSNSVAGTVKIRSYEIMSADGTIPADRLASTTGLADGNYRLRLVMASGVPTLEWVAE